MPSLHQLIHHDGTPRTVEVTGIETVVPEGQLIVSRTDRGGRITDVNAAFAAVTGWSTPDLIGRPHHIVRHPDTPADVFADMWATIGRGEQWRHALKNLRADGGYYWVQVTVIPNVKRGKILGYTSVQRALGPDLDLEQPTLDAQRVPQL